MNKLDWIMFAFGLSGFAIAWLSSVYYTKIFRVLAEEIDEILKEQQEVVLESLHTMLK